MASFARDHWQLRSAELSHAASPETFWIPSATERAALRRGRAAKLIFDVEVRVGGDLEGEGQRVDIQGERMWVIVRDVLPDGYLGILDNQPTNLSWADEDYLRFGCEVPFRAEHVIDIADPPQD